jgi:isoquinoline 1-oxidoreductase alpha subunit
MPTDFTLNGEPTRIDVDPSMPLLWVLRDVLNLTGTKFGCGIGQCGSCTVHINGAAVRSCVLPAAGIAGADVTTIEGLNAAGMGFVQDAWIAEEVPQCGYCQVGQIMTAAALLKSKPSPSEEDIEASMGNLCRCGTYNRIRAAVHRCAAPLSDPQKNGDVETDGDTP